MSHRDERFQHLRELALSTGSVGVVAEIADDLHDALLLGGGLEKASGGTSEETLACEFQDGIIFASRPEKVTGFGCFDERLVLAGEGSDVEPGEHEDRKSTR